MISLTNGYAEFKKKVKDAAKNFGIDDDIVVRDIILAIENYTDAREAKNYLRGKVETHILDKAFKVYSAIAPDHHPEKRAAETVPEDNQVRELQGEFKDTKVLEWLKKLQKEVGDLKEDYKGVNEIANASSLKKILNGLKKERHVIDDQMIKYVESVIEPFRNEIEDLINEAKGGKVPIEELKQMVLEGKKILEKAGEYETKGEALGWKFRVESIETTLNAIEKEVFKSKEDIAKFGEKFVGKDEFDGEVKKMVERLDEKFVVKSEFDKMMKELEKLEKDVDNFEKKTARTSVDTKKYVDDRVVAMKNEINDGIAEKVEGMVKKALTGAKPGDVVAGAEVATSREKLITIDDIEELKKQLGEKYVTNDGVNTKIDALKEEIGRELASDDFFGALAKIIKAKGL